MICLFCKYHDTDVVETRPCDDGISIRRRRQCSKCHKRFTTYERVEQVPLVVIKKDARRERFSREKLMSGILKAIEKTSVSLEQADAIADVVEIEMKQQETTEIPSKFVGEIVARELKNVDKIAYIRFASVFKRFCRRRGLRKRSSKIIINSQSHYATVRNIRKSFFR
ncbi:MAG: Transcriptional repressor NrdR [Microgenomates bacterium OLB22]|nr:MAG: Transcriptional repressor NrdR [Microgenomates bacterium OLB22]